ncbi:SIS domain-containing protein [uncultured Roseibium sp.]|uniref:SIS domain-containing protein n=1 Tax=uncultured Roseibium sp. TaxID=1936171 RepID=UPI00261243B8|nr:SIS domain-containing protein [uncultured Roseibium sp.]
MSDTPSGPLGDRVERFKLLNAKMAEQVTRTASYRCLRPYPHAGKNKIRRIVMMGMGCSAVVGDLLRLFLFAEHSHVEARVINDYRLDWYFNDESIADPHTVFVLCSYSGSSQEPLIAYDYLAARTKNIVVWSSGKGGDELETRALADGHAAFQWQLAEEDPEYPLFSAVEFFASATAICRELGILSETSDSLLKRAGQFLSDHEDLSGAAALAERLVGRDLLVLSNPVWDESVVKLIRMYFNEIAMVNIAANLIHEFTHSQIAAVGPTSRPLSILILRTPSGHAFEEERVAAMKSLLSTCPSAGNVDVHEFKAPGGPLLDTSLHTLHFFASVAAHLSEIDEKPSYELISNASGNPWYNQGSIKDRGDRTRLAGDE